jgi:hypothetical protein
VGEHLHDHPDVVQVVDGPQIKDSFGMSLAGLRNVWQGMSRWRHERRGLLTSNFAEAGGFIRSGPQEAVPDLQLHFVVGKLVDHGRKTLLGHGYSCHVCLLQPRSRGSVKLASADAAPCLIDPAFFAEAEDMQRMVRGVRRMREILGQPALARFEGRELEYSAGARSDEEIEQFIRRYADTIYHPVGSCRMGPGEGCGRCPLAGAWCAGAARGRCLGHAAHRERQYECADHHDCREGGRSDQGRRTDSGQRSQVGGGMILAGRRRQSGAFHPSPALILGLLQGGSGMAGQLVEAQALPG